MRDYDPGKPLISLHVPKCAGVSMMTVLSRWFRRRLFLHYCDEKRNRKPRHRRLRTLVRRRWRRRVCVHGHFEHERGFGTDDCYPEVEQFITILRDPFDMMASDYFYVKQTRKAGTWFRDGRSDAPQPASLREYIETSPPFLMKVLPPYVTADNWESVFDERFVYVGIVEDLQASVDALARRLGFETVPVPVSNVSMKDEDVPEDFRAEYRRRHPLEYAMYDFARAHYHG